MQKYRAEMVQRDGTVVFLLPDREELSSSPHLCRARERAGTSGRAKWASGSGMKQQRGVVALYSEER
jgi:hypothetical protein